MIIINAFISNADLILLVLFSGGAIYMLTSAGVLQALVALVARRFSNRLEIFIPVLMLVFALICTTQGVNTFIGFAPITVMLALSLGLDSIVGVGIILLGGAIGFSTGTLNVSTMLVAQKIAELPTYSGIGYRWICFAVYYVVTSAWLVHYAKKVRKNPECSPMYDLDKTSEFKSAKLEDFGEMDARKVLCIIALVAVLVLIVYGCIYQGWGFAEQSAAFLVFSVVVGIIAGFGANKICAEFMNGCKKMLAAGFIIGFARAIGGVLSAGVITDTIVHALAVMLTGLPSALLGVGMLFANTVINVFLTSGSGQAAAVMPIMIPLSDLLGITRQTCVLSFNFGDGFCNYILPTSTALMGILSAGSRAGRRPFAPCTGRARAGRASACSANTTPFADLATAAAIICRAPASARRPSRSRRRALHSPSAWSSTVRRRRRRAARRSSCGRTAISGISTSR